MLRQLYYALPPRLRFIGRRLYYLPKDLLRPLPGLSPPRGYIYTGGSGDHFARQGAMFRDFLVEQAGLTSSSHVLDIGSGIGRLAIPLTGLIQEGSYHGFDVVELGVKWCKANISTRFPQFEFTYVDLKNDLYTATGTHASSYQFPFEKNSFDVAVATSVFSHMLPDEVTNYLKQTSRVLRPGARFVATFFILDAMSRDAKDKQDGLKFHYERGHYALLNEKVTAANVAYERSWLEETIRQSGFSIEQDFRGYWSGLPRMHDIAFQDTLVLKVR